jgi:hypothetical protein
MSHREGGGRPKIAQKKANIKAFLTVLKLAFSILNFYQSMMDMEKTMSIRRKERYTTEVMKSDIGKLLHPIKVCSFLLQTKVLLFLKI